MTTHARALEAAHRSFACAGGHGRTVMLTFAGICCGCLAIALIVTDNYWPGVAIPSYRAVAYAQVMRAKKV